MIRRALCIFLWGSRFRGQKSQAPLPGKAGGPVKIYAKSAVNDIGAASAAGGLRSPGAASNVVTAAFNVFTDFEVFDSDLGFLFLHSFVVVIWFGFVSCFSPRITIGLHP